MLRQISDLEYIWDLYVVCLKKIFVGKTTKSIFPLTRTKIVLIVWPKIPKIPQSFSAHTVAVYSWSIANTFVIGSTVDT